MLENVTSGILAGRNLEPCREVCNDTMGKRWCGITSGHCVQHCANTALALDSWLGVCYFLIEYGTSDSKPYITERLRSPSICPARRQPKPYTLIIIRPCVHHAAILLPVQSPHALSLANRDWRSRNVLMSDDDCDAYDLIARSVRTPQLPTCWSNFIIQQHSCLASSRKSGPWIQ